MVPRMEADGYVVAPWVHQMLDSGRKMFYQRDSAGRVIGVYDPASAAYVPVTPDPRVIPLRELRRAGKEVARNGSAGLIDLDDGIALLEFHSKANAIDEDILAMTAQALQRLQTDFDGLVIGNDASVDNFCAGANIFFVAMGAQSGQFDQIEKAIKASQDLMQQLRYAP